MMKYPVFQTARLDVPAIPGVNPISCATERPTLFEDVVFSDVWVDAHHARTEFACASVRAMLLYFRIIPAQADVEIANHADRKAAKPNVP